MDSTYNMQANQLLFKLSDIYNQEQIQFDNCLGENLFGKLILHRVENIVYKKLKQNGRNMGAYEKCFDALYKHEIAEITAYEENLAYVCKVMKEAKFKYAFLKGAFLIPIVYEKGLRYSNDIDILIDAKDIDECQTILLNNGFVQGHVVDGVVYPATRREIVLSRMNFGETAPFCKVCGDRVILVDINFSLDYKPTSETRIIQSMLDSTIEIKWKNYNIRTLNILDFIIHLCMHLYKEATTLDWLKRRKDLNLYKFNDLNVVFHECVSDHEYREITELIITYGVQKECYYALLYASKIYSSLITEDKYVDLLKAIKPEDTSYLYQIVDPENKKIFMHNMSFEEWFACEDRVKQLVEVSE